MALTFRYRYVDFGTRFTGDPRLRGDSSTDSPGTLFANELVTDVGGTCWGTNEPLAIIDHHFAAEGQFPSASAAVLHKAKLIRERFGNPPSDVLWLVSHKEPDFDAFCSMYLARWIIESSDGAADWEDFGLHSDGWLDLPQRAKIDWLNPNPVAAPPDLRWPLLLAGYASALDARRPIACPRRHQLNSVLLAALQRGRDYLNETSGATEFFDEARRLLQSEGRNPLFDSVLEGSAQFAPELAMLDHESEAFERDVRRARKAIVYLPEAEAPSPRFFKHPKEAPLEVPAQDVSADDLLLADTFRIPTAGIYLRDPECRLFREWAQLDVETAPLGTGFEFTAIADSNGRPGGVVNRTDYVFAVDGERANGRHLFTLWSRLETKEVEAGRARREALVEAAPTARMSDQHSPTLGALLADPWFGGQNTSGTLVRTPARGTLIGPPGGRSDLRDDPVVEEVRTELEGPVYSAESLVAGPQVAVLDLSAARSHEDLAPRQFDLNDPLKIPPPPESCFRFATVQLRADVPIPSQSMLDRQIAETLWQVLYPEMPGATPADFEEHHLVVTASAVGVWGDRGIAVAQKHPHGTDKALLGASQTSSLLDDFAALVSLLRDVDRLRADLSASVTAPSTTRVHRSAEKNADRALEATAARAESLVVRAAEIKHALSLPGRDLLRHFAEVIGVDQFLATLRDLSQTAAENLRRRQLVEQSKLIEERNAMIAKLRSRLEWLEVFVLGFFAPEITKVITRLYGVGNTVGRVLILLSGPVVVGLVALILKPWKRKTDLADDQKGISQTILAAVIGACVVGWLAGFFWVWRR
jgi:hypothetical protein